MIRWFAKNDIATNLMMIGILVLGVFIALPEMPVEINPSYPHKAVSVNITSRGSTPEDMERQVIIPIENRLSEINGIKKISVWGYYSRAYFFIEASDQANLQNLKAEIESAVDSITSLPADAERPQVYVPDSSKHTEVISLIISGDLPSKELVKVARRVRDDLMSQPGISYIQVQGIKKRRIYIEPSIENLRTHGVTLSQISKAISDNSIDLTAGTIHSSARGFIVTAKNQAVSRGDFENIKIRSINGADLRIGEIADVTDSADEEDKIIMINGKPCIRIEAMRLKDESALVVADTVKDYVAKAKDKFPEGIELYTWEDESIGLRSRISILKENLIQGALLVIIVLALFLRPSLAFFVVAGVPISFAGGLLLMYLMGVSINMWTLFGFIIVLGIVVDDAIVTAENVHTKLQKTTNRLDAVVDGTKEVATPVTFGVITTIVAFIPLMFLNGQLGNISKQIPLVIIPVLIFSLIESKFILPGHLKHNYNLLGRLNPFPYFQKYVNTFMDFVIAFLYEPFLRRMIHFRHAVVVAAIAILISTVAYLTSPHFKKDKMPSVEKNIVSAEIEMQSDSEIPDTHKQVLYIASLREQLAQEFTDGNTGKSLIGNIFHTTGGKSYGKNISANKGYLYLEVTPPSLRDPDTKHADYISNDTIAERWRELIGEIEGANHISVKSQIAKSRAFDAEKQIEFEIRGDAEESKALVAEEIKLWIKDQYWGAYASHNIGRPTKQLNFKVNENGVASGLTDKSLASQVRSQLLGEQAQRFQDGEDEVRVYVRLPEEIRENPQALNEIRIRTRDGETSFKSVATTEESESRPNITRVDRSRTIKMVAATTNEEKNNADTHIAELATKLDQLSNQHLGVNWRFTGQIAKNAETERLIMIGGVSLCLVIFALLAIPFKSIIQPFFVMIAVPLGVVGALLGHYHMGVTVSYLSLFGVLALAGVVVNDSLVIVDFINKRKQQSLSILETIVQAGILRFRPIMLTSVTTFAGLYPIMMETSPEAAFLKPMAISLGFGILYATLITLILIPCTYMVAEDIKQFFRWFFMRLPKVEKKLNVKS